MYALTSTSRARSAIGNGRALLVANPRANHGMTTPPSLSREKRLWGWETQLRRLPRAPPERLQPSVTAREPRRRRHTASSGVASAWSRGLAALSCTWTHSNTSCEPKLTSGFSASNKKQLQECSQRCRSCPLVFVEVPHHASLNSPMIIPSRSNGHHWNFSTSEVSEKLCSTTQVCKSHELRQHPSRVCSDPLALDLTRSSLP